MSKPGRLGALPAAAGVAAAMAVFGAGAAAADAAGPTILPNALPEIFTGLRTSMGVCWGTLVAAELVAADQGVGSMMMIAKNFCRPKWW